MIRRRLFVAGWLWASIPAAAHAGAAPRVTGTVVWVSDGDSLTLRPADGGAPIAVRLWGIDAPEICQPGGAEARAALQALVRGRTVTLEPMGRDAHGRLLARVRVGGVDVGERLVRDGHAWSYGAGGGPFAAQERTARSMRRGVHAAGDAERPRDFRRRHGPCRVAAPAR